jgi:nitrate/nitrite-specific signal transduction histidine kinase
MTGFQWIVIVLLLMIVALALLILVVMQDLNEVLDPLRQLESAVSK